MKKLECRRFPQVSYICIELHLIAIFFSSSSLSLRVQVLVLVKLIKAKSHTLIVKFLFFSSFFLSISLACPRNTCRCMANPPVGNT